MCISQTCLALDNSIMHLSHLAFQIQTNQTRVHPHNTPLLPKAPLLSFCTVGHHLLAPLTPEQLGTAPMLYSPLKLFKLASPKPAYPALPITPYRSHNKVTCPQFPPLQLCLVTNHSAPLHGLHGETCTPSLGICKYHKTIFSMAVISESVGPTIPK